MFDSYDVGQDPYIDPVHGILKNKLGITDPEELRQIEADLVTVQIVDVTLNYSPQLKAIDFRTFLHVHKQLFGDIYEWAGKIRNVDLAKGDTKFAKYDYIESEGERIFQELKDEKHLEELTADDEYIERLAHYYSELNVLHPFREGNGRTLRTFLSVLAYQSRRMYIDWSKVDPEENTEASIRGFAGDETQLVDILRRITFEVDK